MTRKISLVLAGLLMVASAANVIAAPDGMAIPWSSPMEVTAQGLPDLRITIAGNAQALADGQQILTYSVTVINLGLGVSSPT